MSGPDVTIIIPSIGDDQRARTIWRAIESAGPRSGASTRIIVVVNGKRFAEAVVERLRATPGIECVQVEAAGAPLAVRHGRSLVTSEFFAILDDDDEFLEDGLRMRLDVLREDPAAAFVVSNGWRAGPAGDEPAVALTAQAIEADPFHTLLTQNWMASASGLYRTNAVSVEDFAAMPAYMEWTYVGFRLASRRFRFLDRPTYRLHDLPGSVSKSQAYRAGVIPALHSILSLNLPPSARDRLRRRLGATHHTLSSQFLEGRRLSEAWKHHWLSLAYPGGWHYALYTRKLLFPPAREDPGPSA